MRRNCPIHIIQAFVPIGVILAAVGILAGSAAMAADEKRPPLSTVQRVDLTRYLGKWYEVASYPAWFQKGCTGSTAEYTALPAGRIRMINRCFPHRLVRQGYDPERLRRIPQPE